MKRLSIIFFLFLIDHYAYSQFTDTTNHLLNLVGTGMISKSDDRNYFILNTSVKYSVRKKTIILNAAGSIIYGRQQESLLNNDYSSSLDFNLYKTLPRFYYWGLATFDKSYSLNLRSRYQLGLGCAYNIWDLKNFLLNISDGIIYEQSYVDIIYSSRNSIQTIRNSLRIKFRMSYKEIFEVEGTHFIQPSLSIKRDYIIKSTTSLLFKIRNGIFLNASLVYNRLNFTSSENLLASFGEQWKNTSDRHNRT
jgi:hypothetical protein